MDTGSAVQWQLVDAGQGDVYIESRSCPGERLKVLAQATTSTTGLDLTSDTGIRVRWRVADAP